jgi:hypothetical protein
MGGLDILFYQQQKILEAAANPSKEDSLWMKRVYFYTPRWLSLFS